MSPLTPLLLVMAIKQTFPTSWLHLLFPPSSWSKCWEGYMRTEEKKKPWALYVRIFMIQRYIQVHKMGVCTWVTESIQTGMAPSSLETGNELGWSYYAHIPLLSTPSFRMLRDWNLHVRNHIYFYLQKLVPEDKSLKCESEGTYNQLLSLIELFSLLDFGRSMKMIYWFRNWVEWTTERQIKNIWNELFEREKGRKKVVLSNETKYRWFGQI